MEIPGLRWGRGGGGSYTVTTRVISALRWAAMRAILMVHLSSGQLKSQDGVHKSQCVSRRKGEPKPAGNRTDVVRVLSVTVVSSYTESLVARYSITTQLIRARNKHNNKDRRRLR